VIIKCCGLAGGLDGALNLRLRAPLLQCVPPSTTTARLPLAALCASTALATRSPRAAASSRCAAARTLPPTRASSPTSDVVSVGACSKCGAMSMWGGFKGCCCELHAQHVVLSALSIFTAACAQGYAKGADGNCSGRQVQQGQHAAPQLAWPSCAG
jgi:hypothetical protein